MLFIGEPTERRAHDPEGVPGFLYHQPPVMMSFFPSLLRSAASTKRDLQGLAASTTRRAQLSNEEPPLVVMFLHISTGAPFGAASFQFAPMISSLPSLPISARRMLCEPVVAITT